MPCVSTLACLAALRPCLPTGLASPGVWGAPNKLQNAVLPLAAFNYLSRHLPKPGPHRLYFDHGTLGLDAVYGVHQSFFDAVGADLGFTADQWLSRVFEGTGHSEADWAARVEVPLRFFTVQALNIHWG
jgi:hypothetical protein